MKIYVLTNDGQTLEIYDNIEEFLSFTNTNNIRNLNKEDLRWKNRKVVNVKTESFIPGIISMIIIKLELP